MSYHNVRDSKGRFTKATSNFMTVAVSGSCLAVGGSKKPKTAFNPIGNVFTNKDDLLNKLRSGVFDTKYVDGTGTPVVRSLTLMASYLTGYVGKGTSKKAPSDKIFAYDVDAKRFVGFRLNDVVDMKPA